jgi:glycolate oxidase FAD binding subunit
MEASLEPIVQQWQERTREGKPLRLRGGSSKDFYGQALTGDVLDTRPYRGIVAYEPTELVITARCGTPLAEVEAVLAARGQMLAFEPPHFGAATVGGCVAAALSGPRRASAGAVRDFVLGVKLLDGAARILNFGGQVMKNVAGYDVSRLLAGSLGTLGIILEVSLKVLPRPVAETTLRLPATEDQALALMNRWAGQPLPVSATCWNDGVLNVRLSGARAAVASAREKLGGEAVDNAEELWTDIREQRHGFFAGEAQLWRLSLPSTTPVVSFGAAPLIEWGGAQRWVRGALDAEIVRDVAARIGGHATLFRGGDKSAGVFQPLTPAMFTLQQRLQKSFDPNGIFGGGRMFATSSADSHAPLDNHA